MADVTVDASTYDDLHIRQGFWGPYWLNTTTAIIVYVGAGADETVGAELEFNRTTDGGVGWGSPVTIHSGTQIKRIACWFDQETPGNTGNFVHVVWMDDTATAGSDDLYYRTVNISDGVLGTQRTISSTITVGTDNQNRLAITKTKGGNLMVAHSTQTELGCFRSTDAGVNWTSRTDVMELTTAEDWILLFPANTADDNDAAALYWDRSANEISVKMYDDSDGASGSWTETSILTSMFDDQTILSFDGAVRHSDGFILGCAHNDRDSTTDDLVTWTVDPDSIASPTIDTTTVNVFTNQAESAQCGILINQQNDDTYIAYLKGNPTWFATVDCVFHKSTDKMASWGTEQAYSQATADDIRGVFCGRTVGDNGGFFQPVFFNHDLGDIFVNLVNDVPIAAAADLVEPPTVRSYAITRAASW